MLQGLQAKQGLQRRGAEDSGGWAPDLESATRTPKLETPGTQPETRKPEP